MFLKSSVTIKWLAPRHRSENLLPIKAIMFTSNYILNFNVAKQLCSYLPPTYILWDVQETAFPAGVTIKRMNVKASVVLSTYVDCRLMAGFPQQQFCSV